MILATETCYLNLEDWETKANPLIPLFQKTNDFTEFLLNLFIRLIVNIQNNHSLN